ncbi:hypothetical protein M0802_004299 [Mischocyttarus mexicanus]|nr:hypothetical protein M0802_004299 [Mischocyttarus mexicanus]
MLNPQVYKDLDIVTAKVTKEERKMAVHHMLDVVDPLTYFSVTDFRDMALPIVDNLMSEKKIPIIVGGTNYYIESVLWKILIKNMNENNCLTRKVLSDNDNKDTDENTQQQTMLEDESSATKKMKIDKNIDDSTTTSCVQTNEMLYRRLTEIDPEMARKLHPNNRRKIMR